MVDGRCAKSCATTGRDRTFVGIPIRTGEVSVRAQISFPKIIEHEDAGFYGRILSVPRLAAREGIKLKFKKWMGIYEPPLHIMHLDVTPFYSYGSHLQRVLGEDFN